ncbi:hypothetical protein ACFOGJ_03210 [Marinibaculum pumilum]|uniref:Uncharacterized protein n=1 Tax=Marinibaculum pumilum TaxID=1766165 RepID=A0ABV7KVF3_9PROT
MTGDTQTVRPYWRRLGSALLLASCVAVLGAAAAPAPTPDASRTIADPAAPTILSAPAFRMPPSAAAAGSGQPLTSLDRGRDDLAKVYRSLNGGY